MIMIKRVYDPSSEADGERILVDRLWPRGVTKEEARISSWIKQLGPTTELRKWFGHDSPRWEEFQRRYARELQSRDHQAILRDLVTRSRHGVVTLVFGAEDREHNNAIVLKNSIPSRIIFPALVRGFFHCRHRMQRNFRRIGWGTYVSPSNSSWMRGQCSFR